MGQSERKYRILVIDDEPDNVDPISEYLRACGIEVELVDTTDNAARLIYEAQRNQTPFDYVICDNHFCDGDPDVDGLDLAAIITKTGLGDCGSRSTAHEAFADEHFRRTGSPQPDLYDEIVFQYSDRILLFSGSAETEVGGQGYKLGFPIVTKMPDSSDSDGYICETEVVEILRSIPGLRERLTLPVQWICDYKKGKISGDRNTSNQEASDNDEQEFEEQNKQIEAWLAQQLADKMITLSEAENMRKDLCLS